MMAFAGQMWRGNAMRDYANSPFGGAVRAAGNEIEAAAKWGIVTTMTTRRR
ncbi:hypothetical protein HPP92_013227 [Vanilla planifolia]|uniref:Uncharacterized protein n=1 Tax=Vanilla planifolia TaxID=51239 RepID=A0A835QSL7_VANPL|nr:hypothetical protein HPP92_013227 [Vanilla planifolia]